MKKNQTNSEELKKFFKDAHTQVINAFHVKSHTEKDYTQELFKTMRMARESVKTENTQSKEEQ